MTLACICGYAEKPVNRMNLKLYLTKSVFKNYTDSIGPTKTTLVKHQCPVTHL